MNSNRYQTNESFSTNHFLGQITLFWPYFDPILTLFSLLTEKFQADWVNFQPWSDDSMEEVVAKFEIMQRTFNLLTYNKKVAILKRSI